MDTREPTPLRKGGGGTRRAMAAIRSSLRRYPPELFASLTRSGSVPMPVRDVLQELAPHGMAVSWLGHATVLATFGDFTVVVDPVLSDRIGPRVGSRTIGLERLAPLPFDAASLRGVDAVLITHAHYDHLDRPTLAKIAGEETTVVVPLRCASLVPGGFREVIELAPGHDMRLGSATLTALAPRHWGARAWLDRRRGFCAYEMRHAEGSVLYTGDTAYTAAFDAREDLDLAVFGIGAYEPWDHMHATPEQAWAMFLASGARYMLPVHHSTFPLSDEPVDEPMERLVSAASEGAGRIIDEQPGEIAVLPPRTPRDAGLS